MHSSNERIVPRPGAACPARSSDLTRDSSRAAIATCASDRGAQQRAVAGARAGRPHASHEKQARATFVHRRAAIRKDHRARACPFFGAALRASGSGGHGNKSVARTSGSARLGSRVEAKNFEKRERLRRILRGRDSAHPRIEPPFELHELARVTAAGVSAPAFRPYLFAVSLLGEALLLSAPPENSIYADALR